MSTELLTKLGAKLDERQHVLATLDAYMEGRQPLTYLAPAREATGPPRWQTCRWPRS